MTDKQARTLTQPSNRAKEKDKREKKTVFKPVFDNPFRIQWPSVPLNLQNRVLSHILQLLSGVAEYQQERFATNRKRKSANKTGSSKKQKTEGDSVTVAPAVDADREEHTAAPPLFQYLVCGINAVTKRLEEQTHAARRPIIASVPAMKDEACCKPLRYVFVCRADIDPSALIDHLPHLVAAFNSTRPQKAVKLVPLPKSSEESLAKALGIRRVAVIGIEDIHDHEQAFDELMENVPTLASPWLSQVGTSHQIIPTHIKHVRTMAPKDMKAAKELRSATRTIAKQRARQKKEKGKVTGVIGASVTT